MKTRQRNLLIIEDDPHFQFLIRSCLEPEYQLSCAKTAAEAKTLISQNHYDLIILDIGLPDQDGYQFCIEIRQSSNTARIPIIMLTGRTSETDKVMGFSLGADDYINKPFNPFELKARVHARLRWLIQEETNQETIQSGIIHIQLLLQRVTISEADTLHELKLTTLEYRLLKYFVTYPEYVLSRSQILDAVWGRDSFVNERTVDTHVSKLRRKLDLYVDCLSSVRGAGYRYSPPSILKKRSA